MIPIPTVRRVAPRCYQCSGIHDLILGDGPVICRHCVRVCVRLAQVGMRRLDDPEPSHG